MPGNNRRYGVKLDRLMAFGIRLVVWYDKLIEGCRGWFKEVGEIWKDHSCMRFHPSKSIKSGKKTRTSD